MEYESRPDRPLPLRSPLHKDEDHWSKCYQMMVHYDKTMCDAWTDEIQNLLIFAGLFSAVVTAFTIETYKMLQEDPNDITAYLLTQILIQLNNQTTTSSSTIQVPISEPFSTDFSAIRINIFLFISLTLSLATVLAGIVCMQWIREYRRYESRPHKDSMALRQMRFEGLHKWQVPNILSGLPLLLQASVVLFFVGILDFLSTLNSRVMIAVAVIIGLVFLFLVSTTILPAFQCLFAAGQNLQVPQCPFKSPQSWLFSKSLISIVKLMITYVPSGSQGHAFPKHYTVLRMLSGASNWFHYDLRWRELRNQFGREDDAVFGENSFEDTAHGLRWISCTFIENPDAIQSVYHCVRDLPPMLSLKTALMLSKIKDNSKYLLMQSIIGRYQQRLPWKPREDLKRFASELAAAWTLEYLAHSEKETDTLLVCRVEQYIRIKNTVPLDMIGTLEDTCLPCPNILGLLASGQEINILPDDTKINFADFIATRLAQNTIQEAELSATWTLLGLAVRDARGGQLIQENFCKALHNLSMALETWTNRNPALTRIRREICINYIANLSDLGIIQSSRRRSIQKNLGQSLTPLNPLLDALYVMADESDPSHTSTSSDMRKHALLSLRSLIQAQIENI